MDGPILIPRSESGTYWVTLLRQDKTTEDKRVILGLRGEDGIVEVHEGLNEGDTVVTFVKKK